MFLVTQLVGFGAGAGAAVKTLTYKGTARNNSAASSYTHSVDIGTASSDRYVIVAVGGTLGSRTISSVTINGVSATSIVSMTNTVCGAIFMANVTSGSGAQNIDVVYSGNVDVSGIGVWTLTGVSSTTPVHTLTSTAVPGTGSLTTVAGGVAVAYAMVNDTTSFTWTNLTEQFDNTAAAVGHSGAHDAATTGSSLTITSTAVSSDSRRAFVAASW